MGKFVMKETKNGGVKFDLKAGNGEVIATSEAYSGDAACKKGIESVRKNAVEAKLEDQTVEGFETVTNPKFEVYTDKAGEFRFRLAAGRLCRAAGIRPAVPDGPLPCRFLFTRDAFAGRDSADPGARAARRMPDRRKFSGKSKNPLHFCSQI